MKKADLKPEFNRDPWDLNFKKLKDDFKPVEDLEVKIEPQPVPTKYISKSSVSIRILQDPREGCGGHLWNAALELCEYFDKEDIELAGKRVLELGAGTALVAMYAAGRGARAEATDLPVMHDVMRANVALNFAAAGPLAAAAPRIYALDWTAPQPEPGPPIDYIIASDCVYLEAAFEPLLNTFLALVPPGSSTRIYLSYQHRRKAEKRFFNQLYKHFDAQRLSKARLSEDSQHSKVQLLLITRKPAAASAQPR